MKNKKITVFILIGILVLLLTGTFLVVLLNVTGQNTDEETDVKDPTMFSAYTDNEHFQEIPALVTETSKIGDVIDQGKKNFVIDIVGTTLDDYKEYIVTLEKAGLKKHSENNDDALEGHVYTTNFMKDKLAVTVTHVSKLDKTMVTVSPDMVLSDNLNYSDEYIKDNKEGAKTKLHLFQLNNNGTCFIIQLKNGHFILQDSGTKHDAPYLLDYLEELAPEGEKPVVEAWFVSHAHGDHVGGLIAIATDLVNAKRICVEAAYVFEPSTAMQMKIGIDPNTMSANLAFRSFKNQAGEMTPTYRPQFGQRYYFNDIQMDIMMTPELYTADTMYSADFNETGIFIMHYIEGQKFLSTGDGSHTGMRMIMGVYDESYMDMEVYAVSHHGINTYNYFTDFCTVDTALFTSFRMGSIYTNDSLKSARVKETAYLLEKVKEAYHHGDGTVVLTFPYEVGTAQTMEMSDWRYNFGEPERTVFE